MRAAHDHMDLLRRRSGGVLPASEERATLGASVGTVEARRAHPPGWSRVEGVARELDVRRKIATKDRKCSMPECIGAARTVWLTSLAALRAQCSTPEGIGAARTRWSSR
jgi:hypothetical protein